ncbi:hypothetical protein U1Q18_051417 [Sarracenia purpurea var. burkii]
MVHYFAVVVIHNDPTSDALEQRICREWDRVFGWEDIKNDEWSSGLTYVCKLDKGVASKLNLFEKDYVRDETVSSVPLALYDLSYYDFEEGDYVHQDKQPISEIK